jgi:hypothetical protein
MKYTPKLHIGDIIIEYTTLTQGTKTGIWYWKLKNIGEILLPHWKEKYSYTFKRCNKYGKEYKLELIIRARYSDSLLYCTKERSLWNPTTQKKVFYI